MSADIEIIKDQRVVLRRLYLENRSHRLFDTLAPAMDFARIWRRDVVLWLESKDQYCVERREMETPPLSSVEPGTSPVTQVTEESTRHQGPGVISPESTEKL